MYKQICDILKQNNFPYSHFLWTNEFGEIELDDSLPWTAYTEDPTDNGILFIFEDGKKYFKVLQRVSLGFTSILFLEEVVNEG
jgi:hypothetical protein